MANQYLFLSNIEHRLISLTTVVNISRQNDILFTQGYSGGDDDDDHVPTN